MGTKFEINRLTNLTTNMDILSKSELKEVQVVSYAQTGITVQVPARTLREGQMVILEGTFKGPKQTKNVKMTIKVEKEVETSGHLSRVDLHFHQFDKDLWRTFIDSQAETQNRVDQVLETIKGFK